MGWEARGRGGRKFFYLGLRRGGKVVKEYFGSGFAAARAADLLEADRRRRAEEADSLRAEKARLAGPERALQRLDQGCEMLMTATLTAAGYHRTNYSKWRRRRRWTTPS